MTPESPDRARTQPGRIQPGSTQDQDPLRQDDALWNLLGNASKQETTPLFARNVVRATRQIKEQPSGWGGKVISFFTPGRALASLAAAACIGLLVVTQLDTSQPVTAPVTSGTATPPATVDESSVALAELIIEESLAAAAEDPSQFTHDELVTIVGL